MNMNVAAYSLNFPEDYLSRLQPVPIDSRKIRFFTLSVEDLVVSKLCALREKDYEDICTPEIYQSLNWELLDALIEEVSYGMLTDFDVVQLQTNYTAYKERFQ